MEPQFHQPHHGHHQSPSRLDQIPGLHGPFNGVSIQTTSSAGSSRDSSPRNGHHHHHHHGHHGRRSPSQSPRTHHHHAGDLALGALHGPALDMHRVDKETVEKMEQRLQVRDMQNMVASGAGRVQRGQCNTIRYFRRSPPPTYTHQPHHPFQPAPSLLVLLPLLIHFACRPRCTWKSRRASRKYRPT